MQCPKCEEGILEKIQFKDEKKAYLCDTCGTFWYSNEHIDIASGHTMNEEEKNTFHYASEVAKEQEDVLEERNREVYELQGGR